MAKVTTKENYRVVIEPVTHVFGIELPEDTVQSSLRKIKEQVIRHVDDVGSVEIEYDVKHKCSFCGYGWEVQEDDSDPDTPKGTPLCCNKAIEEFNQQKPTTHA